MQSPQQWALAAGADLTGQPRSVFFGIVSHLNDHGFVDGTATDLVKRSGAPYHVLHGIKHTVKWLEKRGLLARRGARRYYAAPWAPPLISSNALEAKIVGGQRARILARDGHACVACRGTKRLSIDHIVAWTAGGSNEDENLQVLCGSCNTRKRDRTQEEFEALCRRAGIGLAA